MRVGQVGKDLLEIYGAVFLENASDLFHSISET